MVDPTSFAEARLLNEMRMWWETSPLYILGLWWQHPFCCCAMICYFCLLLFLGQDNFRGYHLAFLLLEPLLFCRLRNFLPIAEYVHLNCTFGDQGNDNQVGPQRQQFHYETDLGQDFIYCLYYLNPLCPYSNGVESTLDLLTSYWTQTLYSTGLNRSGYSPFPSVPLLK